ncbi:response regulator transcription factor [Pseudonocardia sp. H11422]|uniref:response regulator transcription factor n=1 Tax=Pseudonocardia sp. H11422 TaxID=2835866 RepID=UPI001BDC82EF|nr:response regulator transcription factor [Pseudonocardia sp. H11422]
MIGVGARVLVVEDAETIRTAVVAGLREAGYDATARVDGRDLESELAGYRPDLVVLDVMLPGRDGFTLLGVVRSHSDAGVVMLTARDGVEDRLRGLHGGADDYVVKPFALAELVARVTAVLRRMGRTPSTIAVGDLVVDAAAGWVLRAGTPIDLTATELRLLDYLAAQRGRVVSKAQILTRIWGYTDYDPNLVEVHISALRRKLGEPRLLHTVRGLGYVLRAEPELARRADDTEPGTGLGPGPS